MIRDCNPDDLGSGFAQGKYGSTHSLLSQITALGIICQIDSYSTHIGKIQTYLCLTHHAN
jgi:hypothetical protein